MSNISPKTFENVRGLVEAKKDEAYAPLLALFREWCRCISGGRQGYPPVVGHTDCGGTGYVSRLPYWQEAAGGALEGALIKALEPIWRFAPSGHPSGAVNDTIYKLRGLLVEEGDTRQAALELIEAWLKEKA